MRGHYSHLDRYENVDSLQETKHTNLPLRFVGCVDDLFDEEVIKVGNFKRTDKVFIGKNRE